jgi:hypothetical protein
LLKRANVGHRAISFPFGDRKSNRTMALSAMTTIQSHFLSCRENNHNILRTTTSAETK